MGPVREPVEDVVLARDPDDDSPKEACGVFGVYAPGQPVAHLTYLGLYALQHRGQESAGMAVSDGTDVTVVKDMGLVSHVFDERTLAPLTGHLAIGHTRYSTTGSSTWRNAQPVYRGVGETQFALGHNGNLVNTAELAEEAGMLPGTVASDSDLVAELVAHELERADQHDEVDPDAAVGASLDAAVAKVLPRLQGAFSLTIMDEHRVIGVRDPNGFRPLCLGRLDDGGWVLASESPALDVVGAHFVREVDPGEMVIIDETGVRSVMPFPPERLDPKLCVFEFVYFARPDTRLYGRSVHHARVRQGELLAEQAPVEADMVMGVPESGLPAAEGYARASGIPYGQGLVKNRYIGRTFIAPSQELRAQGVRMKLNPLKENLAGKRVVVVDDSVVRGTTQKQLVKMLRESGVKEVHLRLTSPPIKWSCFYGIDTGRRSELLAHNLTVDEIRDYLNVDSIAFITLDRLISSTGTSGAGFCDACFTGNYPVAVPVSLTKGVLEVSERVGHTGEAVPVPAPGDDLFTSTRLPADDAHQGS
ncbi:amidophosphoribosyltransferase [Aquihabitans sp. G128]|uniref:amidophosphoribosyltransferase n=1 Tax=Aquihabitans sp. G128 TaxID=2849779 RepID=UPI001C21ED9E|nr:amidophosphoribosyltransferase [Aquihabitans sp. G128]